MLLAREKIWAEGIFIYMGDSMAGGRADTVFKWPRGHTELPQMSLSPSPDAPQSSMLQAALLLSPFKHSAMEFSQRG